MIADFHAASDEDVNALCNGVGPQYAGPMCRWIPLRKLFDSAADEHDWDYWVGGGRDEFVRANVRFLANCLLAVANHSPVVKMPWHAVMGIVYFLLVKYGGKLSFSWREAPLTQEQMHVLALDRLEKRVTDELEKEK